MGESLVSVVGARPGYWDFGDGSIGKDQEVCFHQGVGDIRQCPIERSEKRG